MDDVQKMKKAVAGLSEALEALCAEVHRIGKELDDLVTVCHALAEQGGAVDNEESGGGKAPLEVPDDWDYIHGTHPMSSSFQQ